MSTDPRTPTAEELLEHAGFLTQLARQLVGDEHRAQDMVQEAYATAIAHPPREARSLRGWLSIVVSNLARNERRREERRGERERAGAQEERVEPGELALERLEIQRALIGLVIELSEEQRSVLYLRYYEGLTPSAIAARLAVPVKTIKTRHTRALAELRARLDERVRGDRRAWVSALLLLTGQSSRAPTQGPPTGLVAGARWTKLALATAAVLVAAFSWLAAGRGDTKPHAEVAMWIAPSGEPGSTLGPVRAATVVSRREPVVSARAAGPATEAPQAESAPVVRGLTFLIEVDCARARELGWSLADSADTEVVEATAGMVRRRLQSMGCAVRCRVQASNRRIEIALPSIDPRERERVEGMLRDFGLCEFLFVAEEASIAGLDIDLAAEKQKLESWRSANPGLPLEAFNAREPGPQGPHRRLSWGSGVSDGHVFPLLLPDKAEDHIGAASFARVYATDDPFGYPSLYFDVRASRWDDFTRLKEAHVDQRLAVVVLGKVRSTPVLDPELVGGGFIEGRFTEDETARWIQAFRELEGPLRIVEVR